MMLRFALLSATLFSAACAPPPPPASSLPACDLKVEFASIGTGIDGTTLEKVDTLLSGDTGILTIDRQPWGKEGEITLCIDTRTDADTARLFESVRTAFPASSSKPIAVETTAGKHYHVPTP